MRSELSTLTYLRAFGIGSRRLRCAQGEARPRHRGQSQNANLLICSDHWTRLPVPVLIPLTFGIVVLFKAFLLLLDLKLSLLGVVWNNGPTLFDVSYFNEKMDSSNLMKVISMQLASGRSKKNVWKCGIEVGASTIIRPMSDHFFPSSDHSFPSDQNFNSSNSSLVSLSYLSMYASIKVTSREWLT